MGFLGVTFWSRDFWGVLLEALGIFFFGFDICPPSPWASVVTLHPGGEGGGTGTTQFCAWNLHPKVQIFIL